jgi:hypothetical protein
MVNAMKPLVLLVAAKWWPLSARMAIALLQNDCVVSAVCPRPHLLTFVDGISKIYAYSSADSLASLHKAVGDAKPDIIVPCDDGAASQCRALYELDSSLRPLIERSLGSPDSFSILDSRYRFLSIARELGLRVPKTQEVSRANDLIEWHRTTCNNSVFKVDGDSGGNGVRICGSLAESLAAWETLRHAPSRLTAWKRIVVDRDPLALWLRKQPRRATVQQYIDGRPANSMVFSWQGRVSALVSVVVVAADGPTGAATIVRIVNDASMERAAQVLASKLHLSGFFGLDFVIEGATGIPYLIEINPRCTQLGHLALAGGGSLAAALAATLRGEPGPASVATPVGERVALFPQALAAGPVCKAYVDASIQDVPIGAPRLVAEMLRGAWPGRQFASRLYHALSPVRIRSPTLYEELGPATVRTEPSSAPLLTAQS